MALFLNGPTCLTGSRFNMSATVLRNVEYNGEPGDTEYGEYVESQDPITGETIRVWEPAESPDNEGEEWNIPCIARAVVEGGIRVAGTTERFSDAYENVDYVTLWTPAHVVLTKRDRITNIKGPDGNILWLDEESPLREDGKPMATVFNVNGSSPLMDPFNNHIENFSMLERADLGVEA